MHTNDLSHEKQKLVNLYNRISTNYDHVGPRFFSYIGDQLVKFARISECSNVLDVATGRGAVLFPATKTLSPNGRITGVDLSPGMVHEVSEEIRHLGLRNVEVYQMDAENLQFNNNSFDAIFCAFAIYFFPRIDIAMSEIQRVLRPGGQIVISTWGKIDERIQWFYDLLYSYSQHKKFEEFAFSKSVPIFDEPDGVEKILKSAGFIDIQIVTKEFEFIYSSEDEFWSMLWSNPLIEQLERIKLMNGNNKLEKFKKDFYEIFKINKETDGLHVFLSAIFATARKL